VRNDGSSNRGARYRCVSNMNCSYEARRERLQCHPKRCTPPSYPTILDIECYFSPIYLYIYIYIEPKVLILNPLCAILRAATGYFISSTAPRLITVAVLISDLALAESLRQTQVPSFPWYFVTTLCILACHNNKTLYGAFHYPTPRGPRTGRPFLRLPFALSFRPEERTAYHHQSSFPNRPLS